MRSSACLRAMWPMTATLGNCRSATYVPRFSMTFRFSSNMTPSARKATSGTARSSTRRLAMFMPSLRQSTSYVRRVRVLFAHGQDLRQNGDELLNQLRVETRARLALNQLDRILDGPGLLVGARR